MQDPMRLGMACCVAAVFAGLVALLFGWPWRLPYKPASGAARDWRQWGATTRSTLGAILGVVLGLAAACWLLELLPRWPPLEDQHRFLLILLPAVVVVELLAALAGRFRWLLWLPRLGIAAVAARILLHGSIYIVEPDEYGIRKWSPAQTWFYLGAMAVALAGVWVMAALAMRRAPGRSVPLAVTLTCAGAALALALSGNASGGFIGLALAAALAGALAVSRLPTSSPDMNGLLALGIVGLFTSVVVGHFFGGLPAMNAVLLFFAPLLCWLPELPYVHRVWPWLRNTARVALVLVPLVAALTMAGQKFIVDSTRTGPSAVEIDYDEVYGK